MPSLSGDFMKTIKQIADEIGVSKQSVQKRISREPLCTSLYPYISTENGIKYIDESGEILIKSAFNKSPPTTMSIDVPDNQQPNVDTNVYSEIVKILQDNIITLQTQLDIKDKQISALMSDKSNLQEQLIKQSDRISDLADKLAELTRNSQILLKQEQEKTAFLLPEQSQSVSSALDDGDMKVKSRPFWQFWKK